MSVQQAPSDYSRALTLASIVGKVSLTGEERLIMVTIPGNPPSKSRSRVTRSGHVYNDRKMVDAENRTGDFIKIAMKGWPFTGNVAVACIFFRADSYRQDVDNMLKHVCDAANKIAWKDDSQVTAILGLAELDPDNPRTVLVITSHESTLRRGTDDVIPCKGCQSPIERRAKRVYCSDECAKRTPKGTLAVPVPCPICGRLYRRNTSGQKYCSRKCGSNKGKARPTISHRSHCVSCAKQLAHNRGGRCRECWRTKLRGGARAQPE